MTWVSHTYHGAVLHLAIFQVLWVLLSIFIYLPYWIIATLAVSSGAIFGLFPDGFDWFMAKIGWAPRWLFYRLTHRNDSFEVWKVLPEESDAFPTQLTSFNRQSGTPSFSPDNRSITFDSNVEGDWNIFVVDANGGEPKRITQNPTNDSCPTWSRDGLSIYFASNRSGEMQIWKVPCSGGDAVQVTHSGGLIARESHDGKYLYFLTRRNGPLSRIPLQGGPEVAILKEQLSELTWDLSENRVYFAIQEPGKWFSIRYGDLDTGETKESYRKEGDFLVTSVSVSPDEKWIYWDLGKFTESRDIMLVENFR